MIHKLSITIFLFLAIANVANADIIQPNATSNKITDAKIDNVENAKLNIKVLEEPVKLPTLTIFDIYARPTSLAKFKGKVVLLNVWATWCAPCVYEMPSLNKLQKRYKSSGLEVVTLSLDGSREVVAKFFKKYNLEDLNPYFDATGSVWQTLGLREVPTSYLINTEGNVVAVSNKPEEWFSNQAQAFIESYLKKIPAKTNILFDAETKIVDINDANIDDETNIKPEDQNLPDEPKSEKDEGLKNVIDSLTPEQKAALSKYLQNSIK